MKPEEKRRIGRPRCRWQNIKLYLKEDLINLAQDTDNRWDLLNVAKKLRISKKAENFLTGRILLLPAVNQLFG